VARPPPTPEDIARGARMKALRTRFAFTQEKIAPGNHTQVINVEKGRNKLTGELLLQYAEVFGVTPTEMRAYIRSELPLEKLVEKSKIVAPATAPAARGLPAAERTVAEKGAQVPPARIYEPDTAGDMRDDAISILVRMGVGVAKATRAIDAVGTFKRDDRPPTAQEWAELAYSLVIADEKGKAVGQRIAAHPKKPPKVGR